MIDLTLDRRSSTRTPLALLAAAAALAGCALGCASSRGVPAPTGEEVLASSIAYHDPEGIWGNRALGLTIAESRPDGKDRTNKLHLEPAAERFEIERREGETVIGGVVDPEKCYWDLREGNFDAGLASSLSCESLMRTRDYYTYLWGLPMKLRDPGTRLGTVSRMTTQDGRELWRLRVTYDLGVGSDVWDLDFDPVTGALAGYRFVHGPESGGGEWVEIEGEVESGGLRLPETRRWYRIEDGEFLGEDTLVELTVE